MILLLIHLALAAPPDPAPVDVGASSTATLAAQDGDPLVLMPELPDRRWNQARGLRTAGVACAIAGPIAVGSGLLLFIGRVLGGGDEGTAVAAVALGIGGASCVVASPALLLGAGLTARPLAALNARGRYPGLALRAVSGTLLAAGAVFTLGGLPEPAAVSWIGSVATGWASANQTMASARRERYRVALTPSLDPNGRGARLVVTGTW